MMEISNATKEEIQRLSNTCAQHLLKQKTDPGYGPGKFPRDIIQSYILAGVKAHIKHQTEKTHELENKNK